MDKLLASFLCLVLAEIWVAVFSLISFGSGVSYGKAFIVLNLFLFIIVGFLGAVALLFWITFILIEWIRALADW